MSTSKLQIEVGRMLDKTFPHLHIKENYRPDWLLSENLTRLELDYYIEDIKTAFEIQGGQHFEYIPHFHKDYDGYLKTKNYDQTKKDLCYGAGITLIEICTLLDAIIAIKELDNKYNNNQEPEEFIYIASDIVPNPKGHKKKFLKKQYSDDPIYRYIKDSSKILRLIEAKKHDDNISELLSFYNRLEHYCERGFKTKRDGFFFVFHCLNNNQRDILINEVHQYGVNIRTLRQ